VITSTPGAAIQRQLQDAFIALALALDALTGNVQGA
jgi:hypothetical protein